MSDDYSGLFGAFPYALRRSDSRLFRLYAAVGGLLAAALAVFFAFALVVTVASTTDLSGGTITFVRSVFILFGFLVVAPLVEALYAVPEVLSWTVPLAGAVLILLVHRRLG